MLIEKYLQQSCLIKKRICRYTFVKRNAYKILFNEIGKERDCLSLLSIKIYNNFLNIFDWLGLVRLE